MREETIKIKCETEGFDEATEQVKALVEAYDGFPPQVQIKGCHDCTINIYPSQTKFYEQTEREDDWICTTCKHINTNECRECGDGGHYEYKSKQTEPQTDCNGCKFVGTYDTEFPCANCARKTKDYYHSPQTERSE